MDLDEDLLALAAGSDEEQNEDNSYSEQEAQDEDEDDYYEEDEEKSASSKKKRKIVSDDEDEDEGDGLRNPYPLEGKFKDEDDRDKIMAMDDLQREAILFERTQELERFQERKYLELRAKKDKLNEEERQRSKKRGKNNAKADKRELLRAQRRKAQNRRRGYDDDEDDDNDEDREDEQEEDDEDEYQVEDEDEYEFADLKHDREPEKETTLKDINNIHIGRQLISKYSNYPEFATTVTDCYAKINVGTNQQTGQSEYRMVQIKDIVEKRERIYKLVNRKTDLYAVVRIGKSERTIPMSIFSDRPITEHEFKIYVERLQKDNLELLSLRQISKKYYELRDMARRPLTDQEITDMIRKKEELENDISGVNIVMKKNHLQQQKIIALENEDFETAEKLEKELQHIQAEVSQGSRSEESMLSRVNERNKKLNQELIRKAELRAMEAKLKDQNKDDDPFSRLKTRTKMFYTGGADKSVRQDETKEQRESRLKEEQQAMESLQNERIFAKFRDYYGGFDEVVKSINLDIDLDL